MSTILQEMEKKIRDKFKTFIPEISEYPHNYLKIGIDGNGYLKATFVRDGIESDAIKLPAWEGDIIIQGFPIIEYMKATESKSDQCIKEIFEKMRKGFASNS